MPLLRSNRSQARAPNSSPLQSGVPTLFISAEGKVDRLEVCTALLPPEAELDAQQQGAAVAEPDAQQQAAVAAAV